MLEEKLHKKVFDQSLLNQKYIEPLESLINEYSKELRDLTSQPLDFGRSYRPNELGEVFPEVKEFTTKFLDVNARDPKYSFYSVFNFDTPLSWIAVGYGAYGALNMIMGLAAGNPSMITSGMMFLVWAWLFKRFDSGSCYLPGKQKISLDKMPETILRPVFAHEYTHHLQHLTHDEGNPSSFRGYSAFIEGHARGVQRAASHHFREKHDNESYLWSITDTDVGELKSVYQWVCKKTKREPNKKLMTVAKSCRDTDETIKRYMPFSFQPTAHAIGNSLFLMAEKKHGTGIYKRAMKGDFNFLDY